LKAALYQMVLHRPFEPARITGHVAASTHFAGWPVCRDLGHYFRIADPFGTIGKAELMRVFCGTTAPTGSSV